MRCEEVSDRLADPGKGRAAGPEREAVTAHLEACDACREEAALVTYLAAARPEVPSGLADRISGRLHEGAVVAPGAEAAPRAPAGHRTAAGARIPSRTPGRRGWWAPALAAAATVTLALFVEERAGPPATTEAGSVESAMEVEDTGVPELFVSEDAVVAGAPVLEELSEEILNALLEEMEG